jgi:hypothetical protein
MLKRIRMSRIKEWCFLRKERIKEKTPIAVGVVGTSLCRQTSAGVCPNASRDSESARLPVRIAQ